MATPSSGAILFSQVRDELGQSNPAAMSSFYNTANQGGATGLMYHNLNMASGNATTAKVAIFDKYNVTQNYALTNWYNYLGNPGIVVTYTITNTSPYDVQVDLTIWDSSDTNIGSINPGPNNLISAGGTVGPITVDTGTLTSTASGGYYIAVQGFAFQTLSPPPPPLINRNASIDCNTASDTDGVGAGTTRNALGALGNIADTNQVAPPPPPPTTFTATRAVDGGGTTIYVNKRTTFTITVS